MVLSSMYIQSGRTGTPYRVYHPPLAPSTGGATPQLVCCYVKCSAIISNPKINCGFGLRTTVHTGCVASRCELFMCDPSLGRCGNFPHRFQTIAAKYNPTQPLTFDNVAVNRGSEALSGLMVEVLAVDDPHLFEESRLAALASAEQQDLHQPFHVRFLPRETSVDLL